jgi:hypothetical protein
MAQILIGILFAVILLAAADGTLAQTSNTAKTQELVASLDKTKYKKKEKKDFVVEVYVDIKNEAVVKNNVADYAGVYESEGSDYRIELKISGGKVEGSGFDFNFENENLGKPSKRAFTLRDARIEGALLTATRVYENGETRKLEAVFVNRTSVHGKNPNEIEARTTSFGLGFVDENSMFTNKVFCELKP